MKLSRPKIGPTSKPNRSFARRMLWVAIVIAGIGILSNSARASDSSIYAQGTEIAIVSVVQLDRPIDSVSERYLRREIDAAHDARATLVVIELDTPGGILDNTRGMVRAIISSDIPIAVYVSPSGAHAASAGTFIASAANIIAMAPATDIGAASVVGAQGEELGETLANKANEDAAALLRSIAAQRGRNAQALEATVFNAKAYSEEEAVDIGIADVIAEDLDELLEWAHGRTVNTRRGDIVLDLADYRVTRHSYTFLERVLALVSNPNVAFLLISLGGLALVVELWSFGTWIPGSIGIALLIIGFAGAGQLPFHWAGVALIIVALGLFTLEIFVAPGFGFFGIAGVIALLLGGVFMFPSFSAPQLPGTPQVSVDWWMFLIIGAPLLLFTLWLIRELKRSATDEHYLSPSAPESIIGTTGIAVSDLNPKGQVYVAGETWSAYSNDRRHIRQGSSVSIAAVEGVTTLVVEPASEPEEPDEDS